MKIMLFYVTKLHDRQLLLLIIIIFTARKTWTVFD